MRRPEPHDSDIEEPHMLSMHSVAKSLRGTSILYDVSLSVRPGEIVGLVGPNGAGKSTTFHLLIGTQKPDRGEIRLDGEDVTEMSFYDRARRGIGYLPQDSLAIRALTVEQNFELVFEATEASSQMREESMALFFQEFGIGHLRDKRVVRLSGGERRRCEIALVFACRPRIVLLDEPFAGIDPIAVSDLKTAIRHLASLGVGILITDHYARELLSLVDRAYVISSGRVLSDGTPEALMHDSEVRQIYLGESFRL
jgi:lipopolysaccharide export system ATP-binding protein